MSGIRPLQAARQFEWSREEQLPVGKDFELLSKVFDYFGESREGQTAFEHFAAAMMQFMDDRFVSFNVTRPWRDGGRDAIGQYKIGSHREPLLVDCALEAKCYNPQNTSVGVRGTSRLISRIRHRQFGVLFTTSFINKQAYEEVREDQHPILFVTGRDIVTILRKLQLDTSEAVGAWLQSQFPRG